MFLHSKEFLYNSFKTLMHCTVLNAYLVILIPIDFVNMNLQECLKVLNYRFNTG